MTGPYVALAVHDARAGPVAALTTCDARAGPTTAPETCETRAGPTTALTACDARAGPTTALTTGDARAGPTAVRRHFMPGRALPDGGILKAAQSNSRLQKSTIATNSRLQKSTIATFAAAALSSDEDSSSPAGSSIAVASICSSPRIDPGHAKERLSVATSTQFRATVASYE